MEEDASPADGEGEEEAAGAAAAADGDEGGAEANGADAEGEAANGDAEGNAAPPADAAAAAEPAEAPKPAAGGDAAAASSAPPAAPAAAPPASAPSSSKQGPAPQHSSRRRRSPSAPRAAHATSGPVDDGGGRRRPNPALTSKKPSRSERKERQDPLVDPSLPDNQREKKQHKEKDPLLDKPVARKFEVKDTGPSDASPPTTTHQWCGTRCARENSAPCSPPVVRIAPVRCKTPTTAPGADISACENTSNQRFTCAVCGPLAHAMTATQVRRARGGRLRGRRRAAVHDPLRGRRPGGAEGALLLLEKRPGNDAILRHFFFSNILNGCFFAPGSL